MQQHLILDGEWRPSDSLIFSSSNRSYRYGDGLFETIRVTNGKVNFLDQHLSRLKQGMAMLKLNTPVTFANGELEELIRELLHKNGIEKGGRIRLSVFRQGAGTYAPETNDTSFLIEAVPLVENEYELNINGRVVDLFEEQRKPINLFSTLKSANSLIYVLAGVDKKSRQLDDVLILNELANLCEATSSNLFISFNNVLYTPSVSQGCIPGIMREVIIDLARQNKIEVQECPLSPEVLLRSDEVFLTNAIRGIEWVMSYRNKRYFNKISKVLVEKLNEKVLNSEMDLQGN